MDVVLVSIHRGTFQVRQLKRPVLHIDESPEGHQFLGAIASTVDGFKEDGQFLLCGFFRANVAQQAEMDRFALAFSAPRLCDDIVSIKALPVRWTAILTKPDATGLESLSSQFEMPLFVDWGISVG